MEKSERRKERSRETEGERQREKDRGRETEGERQRQRDRGRKTEEERQRETREERQREKSFDPTLTFHCKVGRLFSLTLSLERDRLNPKRPEGREGKKDTFSLRGT